MVRSWGAQELFLVSSCFLEPIRFASSLDNLFFLDYLNHNGIMKNDERTTVASHGYSIYLFTYFIILFNFSLHYHVFMKKG